jgi:D-alanyl-D-alanine dipeptidase
VGHTLRAGIRVRELVGDTPVGRHYRAEYPSGIEVSVLILGSGAELAPWRPSLQPAKRIQHPNVVLVHELNETDDGLVYAVTEPITGEFLSVTLARRGVLPLEEALDLCLQAAAGVQAAHEIGWVHGKLSPHTILLAHRGRGRPLVKLIGFPHEFPLQKSTADSPADWDVYASPERIAGRPTDERSDVFSLGAVLHHLLTQSGGVPQALGAVLSRALAPAPAQRFQTVAEFAAALAPSHEVRLPILPPSAPAGPAWKRALAFGAAAAIIAVAAGILLPWDAGERSAAGSADAGPEVAGYIPAVDSDSAPTGGESPLVDVQSVDSTIQVDLRYATANNFTGAPLPGYEASRALLHPEVAAAVGRVQARLRRDGLGLRIFDAYRPVRATRAMADWAERNRRRELFESGFIGRRSQHNLGVAVDITLVDLETGTEVPNPAMLSRTMKSEGFSTLGQASYHFVYEVEGVRPLDRVIR